jgi:S4 domain protein YaaA
MNQVKINTEFITLGQLLKFENIVESGGSVKDFLTNTTIKVNHVSENRRGKKLYHKDTIEIKGFGTFEVVRDEN